MKLFTVRETDLEDAKALCTSIISNIKDRRSWKAWQDAMKLNDILLNAKGLKE